MPTEQQQKQLEDQQRRDKIRAAAAAEKRELDKQLELLLDDLPAPSGCAHGCFPSGDNDTRVHGDGPPVYNSWRGPGHLAEEKQTSHERSAVEGGMGGGRSFAIDGRPPFGPAPIVEPPWGDVGELPEGSWQANPHVVNHMLDRGLRAVATAKEALTALYGPLAPRLLSPAESPRQGVASYVSAASRAALIRRLTHAIVTSAPLTVALGGHSATQASGNHFNQSKAHWFHAALAPPLEAVGVQLVTRNHAMGGLGSVHRASCFATSYGADADVVAWDYGMTGGSLPEMDLFFKQAMQQPRRPALVLWQPGNDPLKSEKLSAGKLVGMYEQAGYTTAGVTGSVQEWLRQNITSTSAEQAAALPRGLRLLTCREPNGHEAWGGCRAVKYDCHCTESRRASCPGAASWHPGWREHRLHGHLMAGLFLDLLDATLEQFQQEVMTRPLPLDASAWHLSRLLDEQAAAYDRIRHTVHFCSARFGPLCNATFHCATDFTPRVGPSLSSLLPPSHAADHAKARRWSLEDPIRRYSYALGDAGEAARARLSAQVAFEGCPLGGHPGGRAHLAANSSSGWLRLRLPSTTSRVALTNVAVGGAPIHWGAEPLALADGSATIAPNAELTLDGRPLRNLSFLQVSGGTGFSFVDVGEQRPGGPGARAHHGGKETMELAIRTTGAVSLRLSHVLWQ